MPLDPFTALGVAGNIVQFVDFTVKLISKSHEIYKSVDGALVENQDLEAIANNLSRLTERLRTDLSCHLLPPVKNGPSPANYTVKNRAEIELGAINTKCSGVAKELLGILSQLKSQERHGKWRSFRQALKSVWEEDHVQAILSKLSECRAALDTELLISLR
jgi:hypothetical protein